MKTITTTQYAQIDAEKLRLLSEIAAHTYLMQLELITNNLDAQITLELVLHLQEQVKYFRRQEYKLARAAGLTISADAEPHLHSVSD